MKRQDHFRRMDSGWPRELDVEVVTSAFADAPSSVSKSSFHHHSTTTSGQSLLSDLGAFSSVAPASSGFGYSQKNFHISDGNLYSVLSPFQSRRSSNRPTFLRGHSCVTSTTTSTTHTGSPHDATTSTTTFQQTTRPSTSSTRRTTTPADASATARSHTKLKFHHQPAPPTSSTGCNATNTKPTPSAHGAGNDTNEPRQSSSSTSSSSSRHFKVRNSSSTTRPEATRFETMTSASGAGGSDIGGTSRGSSWFDTRFGEPMFTDRLHSESGVDSLLSKRLKCHQQRRRSTTTSTMDMEEEEVEEEKDHLKEESKHDTNSSSSRHPHRRRLFDEHLGDWDSEEISLSSSKRSSSSSYRRRFSSSTSCTGSTATNDKWDMDDEDVVYDRPLNLCMADRPRKPFSSSATTNRHQRADLDSASSASKLTIADSDDDDGDTFPFGSGAREFRRDRKLNFSNLFDDFHSSMRSRHSRSDNASATAAPPQPPTKDRVSTASERDVIARPKVEVNDDVDEDMFDRHSMFDYASGEPRVLDLSTKRRLSQGGAGGCRKTSAFAPFGQKRSSHQPVIGQQPEVQNVFHATVGASGCGRSPVIVQRDSAGYEVPVNLAELRGEWKTTSGQQQHKRFPQMSEMFENLRLQDDDMYQNAADRYQRYQVLRERLMETHPEMFVGWEERDRFPIPSQHHQPTPQQRRSDNDTPLSSPNLYQPDLYGSKDNLDCPKLHRPPSSPNQRPRSWDLPRAASFTQSCSPAATPASSCTITVNSGPPDPMLGIAKSESADACLQQSSSSNRNFHHSGSSQSCYNIPITTSATFPMCPSSDQQQMSALGNVTVVSQQQQKQQWIPYSTSSQLLPSIQPTVIRVVPCTGDASSYATTPQSVAPSTELKTRPPTPSTSGGRGVSKSKQPEPKIKTEIGGGVISHSRYKTRQRSASSSKITAHHHQNHHQDNLMSQQQQQQLQQSTSHNQYNNDISICKFKLIKGVNPVLEEKKSFFVPQQRAASAQQLYSTHQQITGMGDLCHHASRDSSCPPLSSGGVTVGFAHHNHPHRAQSSTSTSCGIVKSASTGTAVPSADRVTLQLSSQSLAGDPSSCTTAAPLADKFRNFKIHVGSQEEMGRKMAVGCAGGGASGAASGSGGAKRLRRRSRKALAREKLEATFREQGFLIKTQQVSSAEGAVYCKFRQLKKFTRYLFKSWKDYLPKDLDEMSAAEGGQMPPAPPNAPSPFTLSNPLVSNPTANPDPS